MNKSDAPVSTKAFILLLATVMSTNISPLCLADLLVLMELSIIEPSLSVSLSVSPFLTIAESIVAFKKVDKPDSFKSKGKGGGDRDKGKGKERDNQPKESSGSHPTAHGSPPKKGTKRKGKHKHMSKVF